MPSKQQRWQLKQVAAGNCMICGGLRGKNALYCDPCKVKRNRLHREWYKRKSGSA